MPERNLHLKEGLLAKYKKELCGKVKFSDVSATLVGCGSLTKDDCFDICSLPSTQQMSLCYEKLLEQFLHSRQPHSETADRGSSHDIWTILLRALTTDHPGLTCKLDSDLQKLCTAKKEKPRRLTKDDIGVPMNFKHLQHLGQTPFRRFLSLRSTSSTSSSFDENDPDVRSFLNRAGVTERHLRVPKARNFIFDFIEKSGGIEAIRREVRSTSTGSCSSEAVSPTSSISSPTCDVIDSPNEVKFIEISTESESPNEYSPSSEA